MTDFIDRLDQIDHIELTAIVSPSDCGRRLDQIAAELFSDYSRSRLQLWIKSGELTVDEQQQSPKFKLLGGETITVSAQLKAEGDWQAEDIPLNIVFEDDSIIVINKPTNFVVHPAAVVGQVARERAVGQGRAAVLIVHPAAVAVAR